MGRFINDKVIQHIIDDNIDDVKEIIETEMKISPFGVPGKKTYIVKIKKSNEQICFVEIGGELYSKVYKEMNYLKD